jgi:hypothetical protein
MATGLFSRNAVGAVAIVEPPVTQWYARRARVAGLVAGLGADVLMTLEFSVFYPVLLAIALGALSGFVVAVLTTVLVRIWPVLRVLWWWSFEITAAVFAVGSWVVLGHVTAWWIASLAMLVPVVAAAWVGRVRRFVVAFSWCLVVRHRLRACFASIVRAPGSSGSRPAMVPLVLWARPTLAGERVWLWLRPGLSLEDLDGKVGRIAVGCWAKQVRIVAASERYAALLRVDVARRDPLTGRIDSPLALLIPSLRNNIHADAPVSPAVPPVGLDLADIPEPAAPQPRGGHR